MSRQNKRVGSSNAIDSFFDLLYRYADFLLFDVCQDTLVINE